MMMLKIKKAIFCVCILTCMLLMGCAANTSGVPLESVVPDKNLMPQSDVVVRQEGELAVGYYASSYKDDVFIAAGTGGRLDRIGMDKQVNRVNVPTTQDLLGIWTDDKLTLICGKGTTLLYSLNGQDFYEGQADITATIFDITSFQGKYFACAEGGKVLRSQDGQKWESLQLSTDKDIISIAANEACVMAVTKESDILISEDGVNWKVENFNETYAGYYDAYLFSSIDNLGSSFFIAGSLLEDPEVPLIMFSETGNVWMFKLLSEINNEDPTTYYPMKINAIGLSQDQLVAVCNKGRLLTITECPVCNQMSSFGEEDLYCMAFGEGKLLIAGTDFRFDIIDETEARQYKIKAEQAYEDFQNGAIIIDVRTDEEYAQEHIAGSLHIPVNEIKEKLPEAVTNKDSEIIFYCAAGVRAQTALETALDMGYEIVYNLGGLSDWSYETETGSNE